MSIVNANLAFQQLYFANRNRKNTYAGKGDVLPRHPTSMLPKSMVPMTPVHDLDHIQDHLWQPIIKERVQKSIQLEMASLGQPQNTKAQSATQPGTKIVIKARANDMLNKRWQFDPKRHAVPAARGILDPLHGLTDHEYRWLEHIKLGRSEAAQDQTRGDIAIVDYLNWTSDKPQDEPLLNEADLNEELDAFYGKTEDKWSPSSSLNLDEGYADTDGLLIPCDLDNSNDAAMHLVGTLRGDDVDRAMQLANHNDRDTLMQPRSQRTSFTDSAVFMADDFAREARKISPLHSPSSFDNVVELNNRGRLDPKSRLEECEALYHPPCYVDCNQRSTSIPLFNWCEDFNRVESNNVQQTWDAGNGIASPPHPMTRPGPRGFLPVINSKAGTTTRRSRTTPYQTSQAFHKPFSQLNNLNCLDAQVLASQLPYYTLPSEEEAYQHGLNNHGRTTGRADSQFDAFVGEFDNTDTRVFEEQLDLRELVLQTPKPPGSKVKPRNNKKDEVHMPLASPFKFEILGTNERVYHSIDMEEMSAVQLDPQSSDLNISSGYPINPFTCEGYNRSPQSTIPKSSTPKGSEINQKYSYTKTLSRKPPYSSSSPLFVRQSNPNYEIDTSPTPVPKVDLQTREPKRYKANYSLKVRNRAKDVFKSPHLGRMAQLKGGNRENDRSGYSNDDAEGTIVLDSKGSTKQTKGDKARIPGGPQVQNAATIRYMQALNDLAQKHPESKRDSLKRNTSSMGPKPKDDPFAAEGGEKDYLSPPPKKKVRYSQKLSKS